MRSKILLGFMLLVLFIAGCKKDKKEAEELEETIDLPVDPDMSLEDVTVPDGFGYSVSTTVNLKISYTDQSNTAANSVLFTILGALEGGDAEELYNGGSGNNNQTTLILEVPNHFQYLIIRTDWEDNIKYFEYPIQTNINAELIVNGFTTNSGDTRSNNCYPAVSNGFTQDNTGFTINSNEKMKTIEVFYTDGTSEVIPVNNTSFSY